LYGLLSTWTTILNLEEVGFGSSAYQQTALSSYFYNLLRL
jgi:hypothetical protein